MEVMPQPGARDVRGACSLDCPDTCSWIVTVKGGQPVSLRGDPAHPFTRGSLCNKVEDYLAYARSPDRVLYPLRRVGPKGSGAFARISWDEALERIASGLGDVIAKHGAEAIWPPGTSRRRRLPGSACPRRRSSGGWPERWAWTRRPSTTATRRWRGRSSTAGIRRWLASPSRSSRPAAGCGSAIQIRSCRSRRPFRPRPASSNVPRQQRRAGAATLLIHPGGAAPRGIATGDEVRVANARGSFLAVADVSDRVRPGVVASSKGRWPGHAKQGATVNATVDERDSDMGGGAGPCITTTGSRS
jgi:anaerobic selenocysteine-containing dehydrogenase